VVSWTGSFGGSPDGMPTIGAIPGYPNCYAVMGYGGNGITFSMLATKLITAAILGRTDPDARLFAFRQRSGAA
jgi:glycine/D-amino acid oxidase-like deaminating enzyme